MENDLKIAEENADPNVPCVFQRRGKLIKDFRKAWENACDLAGVPHLRVHDLRRSACRNMRKAGGPQAVRMKITGHKTTDMEPRYRIVDGDDFQQARKLMEKGGK